MKRDINDKYYYIEQEYGWAGSLTTRNLEFFEVRELWFDKRIGKIIWESSVSPVKVNIKEEKNNLINLKIIEANRPMLDTNLSNANYFEFSYKKRKVF